MKNNTLIKNVRHKSGGSLRYRYMIEKFDCRECEKYKTCNTLCAKAEEYVNQDQKRRPKKELLFSEIDIKGKQTALKSHEVT